MDRLHYKEQIRSFLSGEKIDNTIVLNRIGNILSQAIVSKGLKSGELVILSYFYHI